MRGRSVRASLPSPSAHTSGRRRRLLAVDARVAAAADAARALQHLPSPRLRPRPRLPPPPPARHSSFAAREQERERVCAASPRRRTRAHAHKRLPRRRRRASPLCQVYRAERTHVYMRMLSYNVCSSCACCCASGPAGQRASLRRRGRVTCTCTCTCTCTLRHSPPPARPAISACLLLGCVCLLAQNCRRSSPSRSPPRWLVSPTGRPRKLFSPQPSRPQGRVRGISPDEAAREPVSQGLHAATERGRGPLAAAPPLGEALEALTARRSARSG